jgi:putative transposase
MLRAYKYGILPTDEQKYHLAKIFGCCRFVYNLGLETKIAVYTQTKKTVNCFDLINQVVDLKKDAEWLNECPSQALQMSLRNLDNAYTKFFKGAGFPKFKARRNKQSFSVPQGVKIDFDNWTVFLPKLKEVILCRDRKFKGEVKTVTVSKTPADSYYISVLVETGKSIPKKKPIKEKTTVGIDVGVKHFATLSDGQKIENPRYLKISLDRLAIENRKLKRRHKKGIKYQDQSSSYKKQRLVVAKLYEKIRNQRSDFLHKASTSIIKKYDTIVLENLNINGMSAKCKPKQDENGKYLPNGQSAKSGLNRSILDAGWGMFGDYLGYKAEWYGKNILKIGRFEPSSKICSVCGAINKELTLKDREWICKSCGTKHDRDKNASINIKNFGLRTQPLSANVRHLACALDKNPR